MSVCCFFTYCHCILSIYPALCLWHLNLPITLLISYHHSSSSLPLTVFSYISRQPTSIQQLVFLVSSFVHTAIVRGTYNSLTRCPITSCAFRGLCCELYILYSILRNMEIIEALDQRKRGGNNKVIENVMNVIFSDCLCSCQLIVPLSQLRPRATNQIYLLARSNSINTLLFVLFVIPP